MIYFNKLTPLNNKEFDNILKMSLRLDYDSYIIGGVDNSIHENESVKMLKDTGHQVETENFLIKGEYAYIFEIKEKSPARYSFYRRIIESNPKSSIQFPRTSKKNFTKNKFFAVNHAG